MLEKNEMLLGRKVAEELSAEEIEKVSGGQNPDGSETFAPSPEQAEACDDAL
jgi:hypothetical protein